jgi:hypothetical protein
MNKKELLILLCTFFLKLNSFAQSDTTIYKERDAIPLTRKEMIFNNFMFQNDKRSKQDVEKLNEIIERQKSKSDVMAPAEYLFMQGQQQQQEQFLALKKQALLVLPDDDTEGSGGSPDRLRGPSAIDSRIEIRDLNPNISWQYEMIQNSSGVGLIVRKADLVRISDSMYRFVATVPLGKRFNLCHGEAFEDQPTIGIGTGFLTGPQEMMTAGHVLTEQPDHYALVFGHQLLNKGGAISTFIHKKDIFFLKQYIKKKEGVDIARLSLDRSTKLRPLALFPGHVAQKDDEIYMLGYPAGLPLKATVNARISSPADASNVYTSLDAFRGNSGSPVFSKKTNKVIGVLVSGGSDFVWTGGCNISATCRIPYCNGEKILLLSAVIVQ